MCIKLSRLDKAMRKHPKSDENSLDVKFYVAAFYTPNGCGASDFELKRTALFNRESTIL